MIYEVIVGSAGSGKSTRMFARAAEQVVISPVVVLVDEIEEQAAFERISDFIQPDTPTFEMVVSHVQAGTPFNGSLGLKEQLEKALVHVPDATHVFIDMVGAVPVEVFDLIGERELVITKQSYRHSSI